MAVILVLINAVFVSASNVLGGVAARRLPVPIVVTIAGVTTSVVSLMIAAVMPGTPSATGIGLGLLAGASAGVGLPLAYRAYAIGPVGIAGAIIAVVTTAVLTIVGLVTGDTMSPLRAIGLVLCVLAILLVTYRPPVDGKRPSLRGPLLAFIAALLFSVFVVSINFAPETDGFWPVFAARISVTIVAMLLLARMLSREGGHSVAMHFRGRHVLIPVAAGAADILGNLFLVLALQAGDLVLLAILAPAAPIFTAIIGRVFLRELMTRWQIIGLVVASGALVLASL